MSATVKIRCHVTHGLTLRVGGQQIALAGGDQITEIPAHLWHQWLSEHKDAAVLKAAVIYQVAEPVNSADADEPEPAELVAAPVSVKGKKAKVSHPKAAACVKGRFFDRLDAKLNQLARFDSNELVSIDLQAMATALFRGQEETVRCQTCAPRAKA